jgi:hypothetical protein
MQNDCIVSNIRAIAISSSIVIGPFWRLINDNSTNHFDLHQYVVPLQQALYRWGKDSTVLQNKYVPPLFSEYPHNTYYFLYEGNESCKSTLEKLSNILLSVVNRQLVDHLDSGSAVSITEEDRLRTTQSKITNLSAEHLFGDLDNAIRRKRNAFLRHHSGVTM